MRLVPVLALMTSAFALAACGGGSLSGSGVLSASAERAAIGAVCGINDPSCVPTPAASAAPDTDGDGTPDATDTDGTTGGAAGGNTTSVATGNRTIAIRQFVLDKPAPGTVALSQVVSAEAPTFAATEAK